MMCQHLYNSLFLSSLPFGGILKTQAMPQQALAAWGKDLSKSLEPYVRLFAGRIDEKHSFIQTINAKLAKLELYDRKTMEIQYAEIQEAYAAAEKVKQEKRERGEPEREILLDNTDIRQRIADFTTDITQSCPSLEHSEQAESHMIFASAYAVFEAVLLQHDKSPAFNKILFNYATDSEKVFDFFTKPSFPASTQDIENTLIFKNIVDYKIYTAGYAEIIDILFGNFSGKEYVFSNVSKLVEYFLDLIGYSYAVNYQKFLVSFDASFLAKIDNFPVLFEFHFLNFLSNIEHMRCVIHGFLNKDTMKMLSTIVGQYNILERHKKHHEDMDSKREMFIDVIHTVWNKNTHLQDHIMLISFLHTSKTKKVREFLQLFGVTKTKNIVIEVLQNYNAVRGMAGFTKRKA